MDKRHTGKAEFYKKKTAEEKIKLQKAENLSMLQRLHLDTTKDIEHYCGHYVLTQLKNEGNTFINVFVIGNNTKSQAERILSSLLGVSIKLQKMNDRNIPAAIEGYIASVDGSLSDIAYVPAAITWEEMPYWDDKRIKERNKLARKIKLGGYK